MVKVKKTRKASKGTKKGYMTIPEVRRSLEHIHSYVKKNPSVSAFRKEFKKVFGTEISEKSASEYLSVVSLEKTKTQHGGAQQFSPASLGYDMVPGTNNPSILPYVAGGVQLPLDSVARTCGQNCFLPPAADLGSNIFQKGGKRATRKRKQKGGAFPTIQTAFSEFLNRPLGMGSPPSAGQDLTMLSKGYNQFASPRPEINNPVIPTPTPVYNASIAPVSRMF
jgi:hypothetical protein